MQRMCLMRKGVTLLKMLLTWVQLLYNLRLNLYSKVSLIFLLVKQPGFHIT